MRDISLRRFPFPYRAALSISNDIDNAGFDEFLALHRYLNSDQTLDTVYGKGLDLEVGDSFWLYSNGSKGAAAFSYCNGLSDSRSAFAGIIDSLIDRGYIDTLHSWGNFSETGGFTREYAQRGLRLLRPHENKIKVWTNHGDHHNDQSIGSSAWATTGHPSAHMDCVAKLGVRYIWTASLTSIVGQSPDRGCHPWQDPEFWKDVAIRPVWQWLNRRPLGNYFYGNELLRPLRALPGTFSTFIRYGFWEYATRSDLPRLLSESVLDALVAREAFSIVYVHLFQRQEHSDVSQDLQPLRILAERSRNLIFVTTVSRLLDYHVVSKNLQWTVHRDGSRDVIRIERLGGKSPLAFTLTEDLLQGVTFYTPLPEKTVIFLDGEELTNLAQNPPDYTGRTSLSVPWLRLKYPL